MTRGQVNDLANSETALYVNGVFCHREEARVSALDRAFLMGDAIYEVLRVQNGRLFRMGEHRDRMANGLNALKIPSPFSEKGFEELCVELVRRNGVNVGIVYVQVSRGAAERTHLLPRGITPTVFGFAQSGEFPRWKSSPDGVAAITTSDIRWGRCDLKTTMLLPNSLAKQKAEDAGAFEAIFVSDDGIVREGTSTSLLAIWDGGLHGHPLNERVLPGVTRQVVAELAHREGIPVVEEPFGLAQMLAADELVLTGTTSDVCPVVRVDGTAIGSGRIGPVSQRLIGLLADTLERETRE